MLVLPHRRLPHLPALQCRRDLALMAPGAVPIGSLCRAAGLFGTREAANAVNNAGFVEILPHLTALTMLVGHVVRIRVAHAILATSTVMPADLAHRGPLLPLRALTPLHQHRLCYMRMVVCATLGITTLVPQAPFHMVVFPAGPRCPGDREMDGVLGCRRLRCAQSLPPCFLELQWTMVSSWSLA